LYIITILETKRDGKTKKEESGEEMKGR